MELIGSYDLVLDGSDNFETRYLVSDACFLAGKPLITAALGMFDGSLTTIRAHETNAEGEFNPTYRCLFPEPPPPGTVPACAEAGVMGALAGVLGSMMALEAIREIVGFGEGLVGRLLMVDARAMRFETLRYRRDPANPLNGDAPTIADLSGYLSGRSLPTGTRGGRDDGRFISCPGRSAAQCCERGTVLMGRFRVRRLTACSAARGPAACGCRGRFGC